MPEPLSRDESTREASPPLAADRALPTTDASAQQRTGAGEREHLGRIVHEVRRSYSEGLDRPFIPDPWEKRTGPQRDLDMAIGAAVRDRVLNTAPGGGELVRQVWVYWALEQPDVAEHPNWLKSWVELDERDREVDDRIYSAVAAAERERIAARMDDLAAASGGSSHFAYRNAAHEIRRMGDG